MKKYLLRSIKFLTGIIPASFFISAYIFFCKNAFLKKILNSFIIRVLPDEAVLPEGRLILNKEDPVVSGAVSFGVYEKFETKLLRNEVKPGMVIVDIGANIGYYTLILAGLTGASGKLYAFEPDPANFGYLQKTTKLNNLTNVELFNVALGDRDGVVSLYLSESNKGDHRIYDVEKEGRKKLDIKMIRLDDVLEKNGFKADLVKMDVQGAEGLVLEGAKKTIAMNPDLIIYTEFWPDGLKNSGADPMKIFSDLNERFDVFEINENDGTTVRVGEPGIFMKKYRGRKYANLICRSRKK